MKRTGRLILILVMLLAAGCGGSHHRSAHPHGWGAPIKGPRGLVGPRGFSLGPVATVYDDVTVGLIPSNAFAAAGYANGTFANMTALRSHLPGAHLFDYAVNASTLARCLDVEPRDAVPSQAPGWVRMELAHGFKHPCVYSSLWEYLNQVAPALRAAGIPRSSVLEIDADYTGIPHIDFGFDGTQYTDRCLGVSLDCSLVTLDFLSIATPPVIPVPPGPSDATILAWRAARNHAFSSYHGRCKVPQQSSVCRGLGASVVKYQTRLWTVPRPGYGRWACFGAKARTHSQVCWIIRPEVSYWSHARTATQNAYGLNGCDGPVTFPRPVHTPLCNRLRQRKGWFDQQATRTVKAYS